MKKLAMILAVVGLILAGTAAVEGTTITFSNGDCHSWLIGEGPSPGSLISQGDNGSSSAHHRIISNGDLLESWCYGKIVGTGLDSKPDFDSDPFDRNGPRIYCRGISDVSNPGYVSCSWGHASSSTKVTIEDGWADFNYYADFSGSSTGNGVAKGNFGIYISSTSTRNGDILKLGAHQPPLKADAFPTSGAPDTSVSLADGYSVSGTLTLGPGDYWIDNYGWSKGEISNATGTFETFMCLGVDVVPEPATMGLLGLGGLMLLRVNNANRKKLQQVNRKKDS